MSESEAEQRLAISEKCKKRELFTFQQKRCMVYFIYSFKENRGVRTFE